MERSSVPERGRSPSSALTLFLAEPVPGPWPLWQEAQPEGSPGLGNGLQGCAVAQRGALTVELMELKARLYCVKRGTHMASEPQFPPL